MIHCNICGKQYKRRGWLLRHINVLSHFTPGNFALEYDPGILGHPLTVMLKNIAERRPGQRLDWAAVER